MNEENKMDLCQAVKHIAWGYVLLHFNINLGPLNVLPNWAGYLLMVGARVCPKFCVNTEMRCK